MDISTLCAYKKIFIKNYDFSEIGDKVITFHGVQLKYIPEVPFHFADMVIFEHDDKSLTVSFFQTVGDNPIIIKNLV